MKRILAVFAVFMLVIVLAAPVIAQTYGGRMAQPGAGGYQYGGQQAMPRQGQQGQQGQQGGMPQSNQDLMTTMEGRSDISMFTAAVKAAGYEQSLRQGQAENAYFVFAPTDQALQNDMGISDVNALANDVSTARSLVDGCIATNVQQPAEGSSTLTMTTLGGKQLTATKSGGGITVNNIKVVDAVMATNGLLAVTDGVVGMQGMRPSVMPSARPSVMPSAMPTRMPGGMRGGMPGYR